MGSLIKRVHAREVFNTKGLPTVEVDVLLDDGSLGRAAAPGGTSRGGGEAHDLVDGDRNYFNGLGVNKAISRVNTEIAAKLGGLNAVDQENIDQTLIELDGTDDKSRLGGNAITATSLANAKAAAMSQGIDLFEHFGGGREIPIPILYVMFGGPSYVGLPGICDFQEYSLIPLSARNYKEGYLATVKIYRQLSQIMLKKRGGGIPKYAKLAGIPIAQFESNDEPFALLTQIMKEQGHMPGKDFGIYTDIAASQFYQNGQYTLMADQRSLSRDEMINRLEDMVDRYPIICMEDCLFEEDWEGWKIITERLGDRVQLIGDDLFVTDPRRLQKGIQMGVANAIVIKPNQIGTITETIETVKIAKKAGYGTIISPRSGELWDPYVVHLCIGQNLGEGKIMGAYSSGESSLNEILRVEDKLGTRGIYKGEKTLSRFIK
jgi:enolase